MSKKSNKNLFSLVLWEVTGSSMVGILFWLFNINAKAYLLVPCIAIPFAMIIENLGNLIFYPVRKISFKFDLTTKSKKEKNENALFTINVARSFIIFSIICLSIINLTNLNNKEFLYIISIITLISMIIIYIRFEYYFRREQYHFKK